MNFETVKREIDRWDPIELLACTPSDEYDAESREIASKFQNGTQQNGEMIYEVFLVAFGTTFAKSVDECVEIAERIQALIPKAGI